MMNCRSKNRDKCIHCFNNILIHSDFNLCFAMSNSTRIKLCKLRDLYLLIKLYDSSYNMGKVYQYRWLSKIMSEENISDTLLTRVENNPCSITNAYPKNRKDKAHFFHQLVTMMMEKGQCTIGEIDYCKHIGVKLGFNNIGLSKVISSKAMESLRWYLAATYYFNNKDRGRVTLNDSKIGSYIDICNEAEEGVKHISRQYARLSIEGELEAFIFCSTLIFTYRYGYLEENAKSSLENSYYSILCKYISYKTNLENVVALVNDRVLLYKQIKQNIDQANIIKTLLYEYPCDTGALEKIGKTVKADVRNIVFSKPIEGLIQDMENMYNLPF